MKAKYVKAIATFGLGTAVCCALDRAASIVGEVAPLKTAIPVIAGLTVAASVVGVGSGAASMWFVLQPDDCNDDEENCDLETDKVIVRIGEP